MSTSDIGVWLCTGCAALSKTENMLCSCYTFGKGDAVYVTNGYDVVGRLTAKELAAKERPKCNCDRWAPGRTWHRSSCPEF